MLDTPGANSISRLACILINTSSLMTPKTRAFSSLATTAVCSSSQFRLGRRTRLHYGHLAMWNWRLDYFTISHSRHGRVAPRWELCKTRVFNLVSMGVSGNSSLEQMAVG